MASSHLETGVVSIPLPLFTKDAGEPEILTSTIPTMAQAAAPDTTQVSFHLDRKTFDDFQSARDQWEASPGGAPDVGWLLAFALQTTDPIQTVEIADEMALDYLRNRISLP